MMYTISWVDRKGVLFRVSFDNKDMADIYLEELHKTISMFGDSDFKDVKSYSESISCYSQFDLSHTKFCPEIGSIRSVE